MKFNISLRELIRAVDFADENSQSEHMTITMEVINTGIGNNILVSKDYDGEQKDITSYDYW